ncbi:DUF3558 family protein [Amycolatopsis sp. WAC 04182]|uniref:DUF3558 family protein n=1 Tax=Amycolatopsis sp. WAC 04182 TaxID=2203198 RepID=UPI0013151C25|nr:DUF3558 family protein [Amycolatopsis sp. WAC 04182]
MRLPKLLGVAVLATSLVAGCGVLWSDQVLDSPPAPARVEWTIQALPVRNPLGLAVFRANPCRVLNHEQVAALLMDPPDKVKTSSSDPNNLNSCEWSYYEAGSLTIAILPADLGGIDKRVATHRESPDRYAQWREFSIDGLPVFQYVSNPPVFEYNGHRRMACSVEVGVNDTEVLNFEYGQVDEAKSTYWGTDRCAAALKAAELVIGNLRGR